MKVDNMMKNNNEVVRRIYTFNAKSSLLYPVMKSYFELSDDVVFDIIKNEFDIMIERLSLKKINYSSLKSALVPSQNKDWFETCLVIDTSQLDVNDYGYYVFEKLIPLLDKESTYSILCGDYIDILHDDNDSQFKLKQILNDILYRCNPSKYKYSGQYYLIYFNHLTGNQRWNIVENLMKYPWFTGFVDLKYQSLFKSYISNILINLCIKCRNKIIVSHSSDRCDNENVNEYGYPFEENGFELISINNDSFDSFLSYKIESFVPDEDDIGFSFNALFPKFDSFDKLNLCIPEERWNRYLNVKDELKNKGGIIERLGYDISDMDKFIKDVYKKICSNYLYDLRENEYGKLLFNVCMEFSTINGHLRRTKVGLKYYPDIGIIEIETIT